MKFRNRVLVAVLLLSLFQIARPAFAFPGTSIQELLNAGRADDAIALLKGRIAARETDAEAHHFLSRVYYAMELADRSVKEGERAVELAPNNSQYHLWLGRAYGLKAENSGVFRAAGLAGRVREQFEKAVELSNNDPQAVSDLAEFYMEAPGFMGGGKDKARAKAETIAAKAPATAHWLFARLAEKDKRYTDAEKEYKAAIKASTEPESQWLDLASFYRRQKRYAELEDAVNQAVNGQPKKSAILMDAAEVLYRAGRNFPFAVQLLVRYLASPEKSEETPAFQAHYLLGQLFEKQGDPVRAAKEYEAALALASEYRKAREALQRVRKK